MLAFHDWIIRVMEPDVFLFVVWMPENSRVNFNCMVMGITSD